MDMFFFPNNFFFVASLYSIVADFTKKIATDYGVLKEEDGMSTKGKQPKNKQKLVNCAMSNDQIFYVFDTYRISFDPSWY